MKQKEEWRPVKGYEGSYEVSNLGRIKRSEQLIEYTQRGELHTRKLSERIRKSFVQANVAYIPLSRDGKTATYKVAQLVAESWIPNPNNFECVVHKNKCPFDNKADNLEWAPYTYIDDNPDIEEWRPLPIKGYEHLYQVSKSGKIRSVSRNIKIQRVHGLSRSSDLHDCKYEPRELKPYGRTRRGVKYHLHQRVTKGADGQTDIYVYAEDMVKLAFPE
jgi:hypothetical protein